MKTKTPLRKILILGSLFVCIMYSVSLKAQVAAPYPIVNNTSCSINLTITFYDNSCNSLGSTTGSYIAGTTNIATPNGAKDVDCVVNYCGPSGCIILSQSPSPVGANAICPNTSTGSLSWDASNLACTCSPCASGITTKLASTTVQ